MPTEQCRYFSENLCRSCSLLDQGLVRSGATKLTALDKLLDESRLTLPKIAPLFQPDRALPSRIKVKLSVFGTTESPEIGVVRRDHAPVELLECPLHLPPLNEILPFLKNLIRGERLHPYNIRSREGELKGIILVMNHRSTEAILRFVLKSRSLEKRIGALVPRIQRQFPLVRVISLNIQPVPQAILEGEEEIVLTQERVITEDYGTFTLPLGPQSFVQVTYESAKALYEHVRGVVERIRPEKMIDLYCGAGGFLFAAAPFVKCGVGVEIRKTVPLKGDQSHIEIVCGDSRAAGLDDADLIVVNPPRRGIGEDLARRLSAKHVIYSSCNPESFIADAKILCERYAICSLAPFDMFPLTEHLEVVGVFKKITGP